MESDRKVLIISAGAAGLQAGEELLRNGVNFKILEAQDYIGGRIKQLTGFVDYPLDLGAQHIHGTKSTNLQIAKEFKVKMVPEEEQSYFICYDKKLILEEKLYKEGKDFKNALKFFDEEGYLSIKLKEDEDLTLEEYVKTKAKVPERAWFLYQLLAQEFGCTWDNFSIRSVKESYCDDAYDEEDDDEDCDIDIVPPWTQSELLSQRFKDVYPFVKLNTPIVKVYYEEEKDIIKLEDKSGQCYQGNALIVAVPLSIMKKGLIQFNPPLPERKLKALEKMDMGSGGKIFVRLKKSVSDEIDGFFTIGLIKIWVTPGKNVGKGENKLLIGFLVGPESTLFGKQSKEEQKALILETLSAPLGETFIKQAYEDHFFADWGANEYIQGLYSYPCKGCNNKVRDELKAPLDNKVFFAGEHLDTTGYSQTVSGAINTGLEAAKLVINKLKSQ